MVKIYGIPSDEEAESLFSDWKQERDDWNKKAKLHDSVLAGSVLLTCTSSIVGILYWSSFWTCEIDYINFFRFGSILLILLIGATVVALNWYGQCEYDDASWPMRYKYYVATKDKTVLESKLNDGILELVLENKNYEVENRSVLGFAEKIRTDIDEVTIDLHKAEILIPYSK